MEKEIIEDLELDAVEIEYDEVYKKGKRRKIKVRLIVTLAFMLLIAIIVGVMTLDMFKLKTVNIDGNTFLTDEDIIEVANIHEGSSIVVALLTEVEQNTESHEIVKNARVEYDGINTVNIVVEEEPILFCVPEGVYLASGIFVETDTFSPVVDFENFSEVEKQDEVLEELARLLETNPEVFEFISQISFAPDSVTEDRIMFVMRDSNIVYVSTDQISDKMSKYFEVVDSIYSELGKVNGVLSFDKGGEFKPH